MSRVILLDTGVLGLATNPKFGSETFACIQWINQQLSLGNKVRISELADYEVRRELLHANKQRGLRKLDQFKLDLGYVSITTSVMLLAAQLWADTRRQGMPTAHDHALDGDVILAAQALLTEDAGHQVIVATNVKHLELFVDAHPWNDIA
jgi:predicted nucleic acid-binding protein